ncbi:universal stress protein [Nodosilinea sp. LEGE 07298]|uniref:universal stress protein n=1 Tax=Nodosilinea sp. LEGE 07298 TaxID=2777970 RepID=UPI00187F6359|nr:universal stress protein [Nodosilinea sp. LEGE 07298]MBE9110337.1 universal stress protein [Nodosilinea sp. LEGE 07298]
MYRKILVALDNSATSQALVAHAIELAQATRGELLLVHSLSSQEENSPLPMSATIDSIYWAPGTELDLEAWRQEWMRYETASLERLRHYGAIANTAGVTTEFRQLVGNPATAICKAAQAWGADLILVGNRGRSGLSQLVLGSVSNEVMHRASCAVLVMKGAALSEVETPADVNVSTKDPKQAVA